MKRMRVGNRGITLIEMLIVIAIIGILAGIGTPNFLHMLWRIRIQAVATDLLNVVRTERARAISLNRRVQLSIDPANKTYSTRRLAYTLYSPLSPDPFHPDIMSYEEGEILLSDVPFDPRDRLDNMTFAPDPFVIVFNPSGTVEMQNTAIGLVKFDGHDNRYELKIFKVGQIDLFRL